MEYGKARLRALRDSRRMLHSGRSRPGCVPISALEHHSDDRSRVSLCGLRILEETEEKALISL